MAYRYLSTKKRGIAWLLLGLTASNLAWPLRALALTGGPAQPEFSSFEPVSTTKMVDEFSGDFSYNLPVLNVPGPNGSDYPLSLSYHSGTTPEEEASWVGYGWTLNPGAITRNTRGFPDDYYQQPVKYWNKAPRNWTVTAGAGLGVELFSKDINLNAALRYNNYSGFGYNAGLGIPLGKGVVSLGYSVNDGQGSFSLSVSPAALLNQFADFHKKAVGEAEKRYNKGPCEIPSTRSALAHVSLLGGNHAPLSYAEAVRPTHVSRYSGQSYNFSTGLQINPGPVPIGKTINVSGSYSTQQNDPSDEARALGYMYSADNNGRWDDASVSDYYVERETPYNKRDLYLGVPFNNADNFTASGEGVGGGFRLHHRQVGEFRPNKKSSSTLIFNIAPEASVGTTFGVGGDIGAGEQTLSEGGWQNSASEAAGNFSDPLASQIADNQAEEVYFRFANDLGGSRQTSAQQTDDPVAARLSNDGLGRSYSPDVRELLAERDYQRTGERASYIDYHTVPVGSRRPPVPFSGRRDLGELQNSLRGLLKAGAITEMSVSTANGGEYLYGYPVLSRAEKNLQYGVPGEQVSPDAYLVTTNKSDEQLPVKVGEERPGAYATSFLLTETRTPDYVDRTLDGPTADDFGGYTKFVHRKQWGGKDVNQWYHWRVPYAGLLYQRNSLSDPLDDMGTVASGDKEVVFLQSVQTKTHTAIFVLNGETSRIPSNVASQPRSDALDAGSDNETFGGGPRSSLTADPAGRRAQRYLQSIELYANADVDFDQKTGVATAKEGATPIKTVQFEYSNELCAQLPNSLNGGGKLTLKRVWFEYQRIKTKISPYTFGYSYPQYKTGTPYPAKYQQGTESVLDKYDQLATAAQNPAYQPFNLDAWGNYQADGKTRYANLQTWPNQAPASNQFDPAAWQLKVITLPTGGQIHVQYEQDDYAYVQDRPAQAMVHLATNDLSPTNAFELDLPESLGPVDQAATMQAIRDYYIAGGHKMYFKFLYQLASNGAVAVAPKPTSCNADYISGYVSVAGIALLKNGNLQLTVAGDVLPKEACKYFVQTQRAGKLNPAGDCNPAIRGAGEPAGSNPGQVVRQLLAWQRTLWNPSSQCPVLNPELSYFRLPVVNAKKGGGLRVKRLLTYDQGVDNQPVLYGSEYLYTTQDPVSGREISSGVATTEPASMREENPLVEYLPRQSQSGLNKLIYGLDRKQGEGPLGEGVLPGPSVGYSRVVVRNIHAGRSAPGYSVSEYATARQYPMQVKATPLNQRSRFSALFSLLYTDQVNNAWTTQGFSFVLNNMHGQLLRQATYPGTYVSETATRNARPTSEQRMSYYDPPRLVANGSTPVAKPVSVISEAGGPRTETFPGREVDLTMASKAVKDNSVDVNFEVDTDLAILFIAPIPFATIFPSVTRTQSEFYTHATSKVVRYPAIVRQVTTLQDGIVHTTVNRLFDQYSGEPVVTTENDEFQGGYRSEKVMASWVYPEFRQRAGAEKAVALQAETNLNADKITLVREGTTYWAQLPLQCSFLSELTKGSLVELYNVAKNNSYQPKGSYCLAMTETPDYATGRVRVYPVTVPGVNSNPLSQLADDYLKIRIVRSGRRNQLTAVAGNTTFHNADYAALTPSAAPAPRYQDNTAFTSALNNWLSGVAAGATKPQTATVKLAGPFVGINIAAFSNKVPTCDGLDPANATISQVELVRQVQGNSLQLVIKSFQVSCNGRPFTIQN